ncbi:MAG: type I DNA topoisomerase [Anaerovoracaceae bacterium]
MAVPKKTARRKNLVIVESPSKAKTIGKFLGSSYKVIASVGHIRDLPKSKLGIDIENDFEPQYINIRGKGDIIKELKKEAKKANKIYLATDPDREGEAISWHLAFLLGIPEDEPCRVVFNEITKNTIKNAVKNPRKIDMGLVDAQQARRILDRLVGYSISPLLWRKVRRGLSAGRVQSATLKMICDREKEIKGFVPEEFWTITSVFNEEKKKFEAKLVSFDEKKIDIKNENEAKKIVETLEKGDFTLDHVQEKERKRNPYPPFTTSSLQQEASNKINFNTRKTMQIAQQLYEGIDIKGMGTVGLITYIRTDSVRISDEAKTMAKEYIINNYGEKYSSVNIFKNKKKDAQDAHEAIRPSYIELEPDSIKEKLTTDQYKLYKLIWTRFMASQMSSAEYSGVSYSIGNSNYIFKATGSKLLFDGFLKVYSYSKENEDTILPHIEVNQKLKNEEIIKEQNFTQPKPRFTEASLVKILEEENIGRPSTYAPIVATLTARMYIKRDKKNLYPTELGFTVNQMMEEYFKEIVDVGFTAEIENKLDHVGETEMDWKQLIRDFYPTFEKDIKIAEEEIEKIEEKVEFTDIKCEECGKFMVIKHGRFGDFLACSGYPECKNTKQIVKTIGVPCPKCGKDIVEKRSRTGRTFYGCSGYPDCDMSFWNKPVNKECPQCGKLLIEKKTKKFEGLVCSSKECDYKEE